jgi:hypothetical protein
MKLFDYVNAINSGKDPLKDTPDKELGLKEYVPFLINKQFSYFPDTVQIANEMNMNAHMSKESQYSFYINIMRPKKRFSKWAKANKNVDLELLVEYYDFSYAKAREALKVLSEDDLAEVKKQLEKGGKQ